jgi:hypothetical protein
MGFASSPVIYDNKVVVSAMCKRIHSLQCSNWPTKELWRTTRTDVPTWGTPTVAQSGSEAEVLVNGWHHTAAHDFKTGKEIWHLNDGGDVPVPTPIVANGLAHHKRSWEIS